MERRRMRRKPSFGKRMMVTMLSLVMLLSLFSPGLLAGAEETAEQPTQETTGFLDNFMEAYDQQTLSGGEMNSQALTYVARLNGLKDKVAALDSASETYASDRQALVDEAAGIYAEASEASQNGGISEAEWNEVTAAYQAVGGVVQAQSGAAASAVSGVALAKRTVNAFVDEKNFAVTGNLPEGVTLSVEKLDSELAAYIRSDVLDLGSLPAGYTSDAYDIKLMLDGNAIQPSEAVTLGITAAGITSKADVDVYHLPNTTAAGVAAVSSVENSSLNSEKIENVNCYDAGYYAFFTNGFSVYYITTGNLNASVQETDYLARIAALKVQAETLDTEAEDYEDQWWAVYEANAAVMDEATLAWENDEMTDEEYAEVYYAYEEVIEVLGEDPYAKDTEEERDIQYFRADVDVYWDEASTTGTSAESLGGAHVSSVKLNGTDVLLGDSDLGSGWSGSPLQVGDYYTSATTSYDQSVKLTITPKSGYYVTHITVACCPASVQPYKCSTWQAGNAYETNLSVTASGSVSIDLAASAFCHDNNNKEENHQYFILIVTAPLPSPLWVEYDYGDIANIITSAGGTITATDFASPDAWTDDNSNNYYGSATSGNGVKTNDTQMKYIYADGDTTNVEKWTHTTNTVTEAAKLKAAEYGYYFVGWQAQYYEDCSETAISNPTYNNYAYSFSEAYGNAFSVNESTNVQLVTNLKLIAQWKPIKLTVTKTVVGLPSGASTVHDINVNRDSALLRNFDLNVSGSGSATGDAISPITPGTYSAEEINAEPSVTVNGKTYYLVSTTYSEPVSVTAAAIAAGTQRDVALAVTNTYSEAAPMLKLVKIWKDASGTIVDGMDTSLPASVTFTVNLNGADPLTYTLTNDNYDSTTMGWILTVEMPENAITSVTEAEISGYTGTVSGPTTENAVVENENVIYSVYTATNQLSVTSVVVSKTVSGNMGDQQKAFSFTAAFAGTTEVAYTIYNSDDSVAGTGSVAKGTKSHSFSLKHGQKIVYTNVAIGSAFTVTEDDSSPYTTTVNGKAGHSFSTTLPVETTSVAFVNTNQVEIDTGIELNSYPFFLMLSFVIVSVGFFILGKKRMMF